MLKSSEKRPDTRYVKVEPTDLLMYWMWVCVTERMVKEISLGFLS